jgi:hypothetical protein
LENRYQEATSGHAHAAVADATVHEVLRDLIVRDTVGGEQSFLQDFPETEGLKRVTGLRFCRRVKPAAADVTNYVDYADEASEASPQPQANWVMQARQDRSHRPTG